MTVPFINIDDNRNAKKPRNQSEAASFSQKMADERSFSGIILLQRIEIGWYLSMILKYFFYLTSRVYINMAMCEMTDCKSEIIWLLHENFYNFYQADEAIELLMKNHYRSLILHNLCESTRDATIGEIYFQQVSTDILRPDIFFVLDVPDGNKLKQIERTTASALLGMCCDNKNLHPIFGVNSSSLHHWLWLCNDSYAASGLEGNLAAFAHLEFYWTSFGGVNALSEVWKIASNVWLVILIRENKSTHDALHGPLKELKQHSETHCNECSEMLVELKHIIVKDLIKESHRIRIVVGFAHSKQNRNACFAYCDAATRNGLHASGECKSSHNCH